MPAKFTLLAALTVLSACGGTEAAPTCADGEKNGAETGLDCGGPSCGRCFDGMECQAATDCLSGRCTAGRCYSSVATGGGGASTGGGTGGGTGGASGGGTGGASGGGTGGASGGGTGGGASGGGTGGAGGGGTGGGASGGGTGGGGTGGGGTGGGASGGGTGGGATGGGAGGGASGGGTGGGASGGGIGGGGSAAEVLHISQVQTRGDSGGNDEFIELYNPGNSPIVFDSTWTLGFRSATGTCSTNTEAERTAGAGQIIPARGHLLLTNTSYNGTVAGDGTYSLGLVDAGNLVLRHGTVIVDALCFQFDAVTLAALTTCSPAFVCEGAPPLNPHNNTTGAGSNVDTSLMRKPDQDSQDNSADFLTTTFSSPRNRFGPSAP